MKIKNKNDPWYHVQLSNSEARRLISYFELMDIPFSLNSNMPYTVGYGFYESRVQSYDWDLYIRNTLHEITDVPFDPWKKYNEILDFFKNA